MAVLVVGVGCRREDIREYTAPKDPPPRQQAAHSPGDGHVHADEHEMAARPKPKLRWKLPVGWSEAAAGQMSLASFTIQGAGGQEAQVTVTPLGKLEGRENVVINMFRQQAGLEPLGPDETAQQMQDVMVGGEKGKLFELAGKFGGADTQTRIITAMVHRSDATWFYKLSGDAALVEAQKPAYVEFLKSIQIEEPTAVAASKEGAAVTSSKFKWQVPADWKQVAAGQMQAARFAVPEKNGAHAEVFVSTFPNDTGGVTANVNRWRRQLKLGELDDAAIGGIAKPLDGLPGSVFTDLHNPDNGQQLIGAIIPRDGQWWFYKLIGAADAVGPQRENFVRFVQSTP